MSKAEFWVQERLGRSLSRNGLVLRKEKGQLGKRQEERKKRRFLGLAKDFWRVKNPVDFSL